MEDDAGPPSAPSFPHGSVGSSSAKGDGESASRPFQSQERRAWAGLDEAGRHDDDLVRSTTAAEALLSLQEEEDEVEEDEEDVEATLQSMPMLATTATVLAMTSPVVPLHYRSPISCRGMEKEQDVKATREANVAPPSTSPSSSSPFYSCSSSSSRTKNGMEGVDHTPQWETPKENDFPIVEYATSEAGGVGVAPSRTVRNALPTERKGHTHTHVKENKTEPALANENTAAEEEEENGGVDYLPAQDQLYLSYPSRVVLPPWRLAPRTTRPSSSSSSSLSSSPEERDGQRNCLLVVFGANDLRCKDHYPFALAASRAFQRCAAGNRSSTSTSSSSSSSSPLPIVALLVVDYRCFAQPTPIAGFFRQSPLRAQFFLDTVQSLRRTLEIHYGVPLLIRTGRPEEHVPRLAVELGAVEVFMTTQYAPHEMGVQEKIQHALHYGTWVSRHPVRQPHRERFCLEEAMESDGLGSVRSSAHHREEAIAVHLHGRAEHPYFMYPAEAHKAVRARRCEAYDKRKEEEEKKEAVAHNSITGSQRGETAGRHSSRTPTEEESHQEKNSVIPLHLVWQSTLVHLHDLPHSVAEMREGERWYHDDVTVAAIRPTAPYIAIVEKLAVNAARYWHHHLHSHAPTQETTAASFSSAHLPLWSSLLPSALEREGREATPLTRGRLPSLEELGYYHTPERRGNGGGGGGRSNEYPWRRGDRRWLEVEEVIATDHAHGGSSHYQLADQKDGGGAERAAALHLQSWLDSGHAMSSFLRFGRERRTNTKLYSSALSRVSPFLSLGILSPRQVYEALREHTHQQERDGFVQQQFREALLRLSRRDFCHWCGLRYGRRLFFPFGPHPENTGHVVTGAERSRRMGTADMPSSSSSVTGDEDDITGSFGWRVDEKIIHKWCRGLTGFPLADAAAKELLLTGFVAQEGREALVWLLSRGLGQDWRVAAEWLERNALDFDPFICYHRSLRAADLLPDEIGGECPRTLHYLAHHHDQTGIYVKRWLPVLSRVPPVYIHRPHIMTPRMQAMTQVYLGRNYPYPIKLWDGAVEDLNLMAVASPSHHLHPATSIRGAETLSSRASLTHSPSALGVYFAGPPPSSDDDAVSVPPPPQALEKDGEGHAPSPPPSSSSSASSVRSPRPTPLHRPWIGIGFGEALRHGTALMSPEEWNTGVMELRHLSKRKWVRELEERALEEEGDEEGGSRAGALLEVLRWTPSEEGGRTRKEEDGEGEAWIDHDASLLLASRSHRHGQPRLASLAHPMDTTSK